MPKKKKFKSKGAKRKYSEKETLLAKLHKLVRSKRLDGKDISVGHSLIQWHIKRNGLTPRQWDYAEAIIKRYEALARSPQTDCKQYLYGISDGETIKLGMSNDIKKRLKALQTASPRSLTIKWQYYTGRCAKKARQLEKKLHRRCKAFHTRGEWFYIECFDLVKTFRGQD